MREKSLLCIHVFSFSSLYILISLFWPFSTCTSHYSYVKIYGPTNREYSF